jgi:lysophospholipase L1-like esterase
MLRRAILLTVVPLLLAPAAARAQGVFVDGDSLAVGTEPYLDQELPGWNVRTSATISRHANEGAGVLRSAGRLPKVIAVSLGTNDDPRSTSAFRSAIDSLVSAAGSGRCIVWATIRRPAVAGASYSGYNRVLAEEARERIGFKLVHWKRMVNQHPEWLAADGVHVNATGYQARAKAYAEKIRACRRR